MSVYCIGRNHRNTTSWIRAIALAGATGADVVTEQRRDGATIVWKHDGEMWRTTDGRAIHRPTRS